MTSCCRGSRDYDGINSEMVAPSKVGLCCGRTFLQLKKNQGRISHVAVLALAALAAGLTSFLYYDPKADPINDGNVVFRGSLSSIGALLLFSFIFEGLYVCKYPQNIRRLPSPCLMTAGSIVVAAAVSFYQLKHAEGIIENYLSNQTNVTHSETALISECRDFLLQNPHSLINGFCVTCSKSLLKETSSTSTTLSSASIFQLRPFKVDLDICFSKNDSLNVIQWDWLQNMEWNPSHRMKDYPCEDISAFLPVDSSNISQRVFQFLKESYELNPPMSLTVKKLNLSTQDWAGCKNVQGFASQIYPISDYCSYSIAAGDVDPFKGLCETHEAENYFNQLNEQIALNNRSALPKPIRAYQIVQEDSMPAWLLTSCLGITVALAYEGVVHFRCNPKRSGWDSEVLIIT